MSAGGVIVMEELQVTETLNISLITVVAAFLTSSLN
jgi:hypothetical protein